MKTIIGYYNEFKYYIELNGREIYTAGNSPIDSQGYLNSENGVGLLTMKKFCRQTAKELSEEHNAKYLGIEKLEEE